MCRTTSTTPDLEWCFQLSLWSISQRESNGTLLTNLHYSPRYPNTCTERLCSVLTNCENSKVLNCSTSLYWYTLTCNMQCLPNLTEPLHINNTVLTPLSPPLSLQLVHPLHCGLETCFEIRPPPLPPQSLPLQTSSLMISLTCKIRPDPVDGS